MNSKQSYYEKNKVKILEQQQAKRASKYEGLTEGYDYIYCKECNFKSSELATHIINKHRLTIPEYKEKHKVDAVKSQKSRDRVKGSNNPAYQHGGKFSPFSEKFIGTIDRKLLVEKIKEKKKVNKTDTTQLDYWIKKTNGDVEEANKLFHERQSTFSLEKCIKKYGEEEGTKRWNQRQEKWLKKLNNKPVEELERINRARMCNGRGYSKISQELFRAIYDIFDDKDVYFATLNRKKMDNNEYFYISKTTNKKFFFDFFYPKQNKIIEFDGDYWHGENRGNQQRDSERQHILENEGFIIFHILEKEYKQNSQGTIEKCINFLTK